MKHQAIGQVLRARSLRSTSTNAERKLWKHLRGHQLEGLKFRRQHPIGPYVADFCCLEIGLVIELDGSQHARLTDADARRTAYLGQHGFRVLRFWNPDVLSNVEAVVDAIRADILEKPPHPSPLPASGERGR